MVHSHMALYTGGEVKYSMQSPPWSTHLLQLWQRKELEGAAAGGQAINSRGAMDAWPLCTRTTARAQGEVMVSVPPSPPAKTSCSTTEQTLNIAQQQGKKQEKSLLYRWGSRNTHGNQACLQHLCRCCSSRDWHRSHRMVPAWSPHAG